MALNELPDTSFANGDFGLFKVLASCAVQKTTAGDVELVALDLVWRDPQCHVRFQLFHEPIAQLPKKAPDVKPTPPPAKKIEVPEIKHEEKPSPKAEPEKKQEEKPEPKKEVKIEPKAEIKLEPKVEVKVEPKKLPGVKVLVLGNDIKLNDPDGVYALKLIHGGAPRRCRARASGRCASPRAPGRRARRHFRR